MQLHKSSDLSCSLRHEILVITGDSRLRTLTSCSVHWKPIAPRQIQLWPLQSLILWNWVASLGAKQSCWKRLGGNLLWQLRRMSTAASTRSQACRELFFITTLVSEQGIFINERGYLQFFALQRLFQAEVRIRLLSLHWLVFVGW